MDNGPPKATEGHKIDVMDMPRILCPGRVHFGVDIVINDVNDVCGGSMIT